MNIRQLYIFQKVCEELNFTKAAQQLYMTQPAVSHVIKELENETGSILFERVSRKIFLTEPGKVFLKKVEQVLELYGQMRKNPCDLEECLPIAIGASITIANIWLSKIMLQYEKNYPFGKINIEIDKAAAIEQKILENKMDVALIEGVIQHEQLKTIPFSKYDMAVICSKKNPLSNKGAISFETLLNENLLLREKGSAIRDTFDSALFLRQMSAYPLWTSVNSQALIEGVKNNLGVSVLPEIIVKKELEEGSVVKVELKDSKLQNTNYIVYHKNKYKTKALKEFIKAVMLR